MIDIPPLLHREYTKPTNIGKPAQAFPMFVYMLLYALRPGIGDECAYLCRDYLPYYLPFPDHLKLNNIPKSSLLCKSITGKLKSHVLIKSNRGVIAPEDI